MTFNWLDNLNQHQNIQNFLPRDFEVDLLAAAYERNIIVCLESHSAKEFITLKLINAVAQELRTTHGKCHALYITSSTEGNSSPTTTSIGHLTDLQVTTIGACDFDRDLVRRSHVIVANAESCLKYLESGDFTLAAVNLIVIENCHMQIGKLHLEQIIEKFYCPALRKPKILGLSEPIHGSGCPPDQLEAKLQYLERCLYSKIETASDILNVLRYCTRPREFIIQNPMPTIDPLTKILTELVLTKISFLCEHRFDPSEIYNDEFIEEWKNVPDPKILPLSLLYDFLDILLDLGPLTADKAALYFIIQIEKFKIKTAYERHFLLLSLVSATFVQVRIYCEYFFRNLDFRERCAKYTTPKVKSLLDVIRQFKPKPSENGAGHDRRPSYTRHSRYDRRPSLAATPTPLPIVPMEVNGEGTVSTIAKKAELIAIDALNFKDLVQSAEEIQSKVVDGSSGPANEVKATLKSLTGMLVTNEEAVAVPVIPPKPGPLRPKKRFHYRHGRYHHGYQNDTDALCGIIFCDSKYTAKALFSVVHDAALHDENFQFLNVQYTVEKCQSTDLIDDTKEVENEHRKQEEVLKRFRNRECNLLIGTSVLETGIDLPKCNLVVRWNAPQTYTSYVQSKGKANGPNAFHLIMVAPAIDRKKDDLQFNGFTPKCHDLVCKKEAGETQQKEDQTDTIVMPLDMTDDCAIEVLDHFVSLERTTKEVVGRLGEYREIEKILLKNCYNSEVEESMPSLLSDVPVTGQMSIESLSEYVQPYQASATSTCTATLINSIHLINNYCAKLPSDTFTKLVPLVRYASTVWNGMVLYQCTIRLPINSPLKCDIVGLPAPTISLASRLAAWLGCKMLHRSGELDDNLQPIGKEEFRASEMYFKNFELEHTDTILVKDNAEPRPGTTKRRQYYFKKIASVLRNCRPTAGTHSYLYHIKMVLRTPIPEEQNTRGRKIFAPEDCPLGFGILTTRKIPPLCSFPIFTRSGEIEVSFVLVHGNVILKEADVLKINHFVRYTFTNVLRLQKYLMFFDETATDNCFFIVPTLEGKNGRVNIDWQFLNTINNQPQVLPKFKLDDHREVREFDEMEFKDAVVMPWYRNQDQPQYFYVAEICRFLTPESSFPGINYTTFKEYYFRKYGIEVKNTKQPLLDVDHTSARLNFLTPRYVNRKGVALPTSSEETKKAKRENLEQKQILIPELCTVHPFPASLWRAAVCLPCILYRLNALLLADEIRIQVAHDLGLGQIDNRQLKAFKWESLHFGWSLNDMMKKHNLERKKEEWPESASGVEAVSEAVLVNGHATDGTTEDSLTKDEEDRDPNELEIGTWNNEMANNVNGADAASRADNQMMLADKRIRYGSPTLWDEPDNENRLENYFSDSDTSFQSDDNDEDDINTGNTYDCYERMDDVRLRIKFESNNVAEAFESEATIANRNKMYLERNSKEIGSNEEVFNMTLMEQSKYFNPQLIAKFEEQKGLSTAEIMKSSLIKVDETIDIQSLRGQTKVESKTSNGGEWLTELCPYLEKTQLEGYLIEKDIDIKTPKVTVEDLYNLSQLYLNATTESNSFKILGYGDLFDNFEDSQSLMRCDSHGTAKEVKVTFTDGGISKNKKAPYQLQEAINAYEKLTDAQKLEKQAGGTCFNFDYQPDLNEHPGPSPSIILQALTMSNANDGINLERLETIGDSFLKFAITTYLYCTYEDVHEGKLSHLRSKYVSNLNLYRLGRLKRLGEVMISTKFEPHDNWLPPCYYIPKGLEKVLIEAQIPIFYWNLADLKSLKELSNLEICDLIRARAMELGFVPTEVATNAIEDVEGEEMVKDSEGQEVIPCFIPYNLVNQHSIPDKSIADCVEALIGAYLIECGPRGALLFMAWIGICVLPHEDIEYPVEWKRYPGSGLSYNRAQDGKTCRRVYGTWIPPKSPSTVYLREQHNWQFDCESEGFRSFETQIGYRFNDPLYLLQAMTHASYSPNRFTDCYQRLEFLGDAVLDYLITRHLYEDPRQHSPGALTDLRSALVNNTIFASLAVRHGFHKYFRHLSPGLNDVIDRFVRIQHENGYTLSDECYLILEEETEEAEDVEVPKALGDLFESVAGAIFLDSGMSLNAVWNVYENIMRPEIEKFSSSVPKSPIRELLELEPETAKFGKPEKLADGRRVRVVVEIFGKGTFHGIGRNYRIAKCTAAKCALRHLKRVKY